MKNDQILRRSPKTQNNFFNNYYLRSPPKKDIKIINFNNNIGVKQYNNKFDYNYNNINKYNYYEEITKAFNFITFILKQKDTQIKELKIKIKELERQLNDINETNIMTFNNKSIKELNSESEKNNLNNLSNNLNIKRITYNCIPNKINNNTNLINRIKNSTNINKINNYRNNPILNNNNYMNKTQYLTTEENNRRNNLNININEHSNEKKNINIIRKEPYYNNMNNIKYKNGIKNKVINLQSNETDVSTGNDKIKLYNINSKGRANSKNSKSNSIFTLSDEALSNTKNEIKNYLREIKDKIDKDKFKKFVNLIKCLIKNKNSAQKNVIFYEIKNILVDKSLINKFETILKIK